MFKGNRSAGERTAEERERAREERERRRAGSAGDANPPPSSAGETPPADAAGLGESVATDESRSAAAAAVSPDGAHAEDAAADESRAAAAAAVSPDGAHAEDAAADEPRAAVTVETAAVAATVARARRRTSPSQRPSVPAPASQPPKRSRRELRMRRRIDGLREPRRGWRRLPARLVALVALVAVGVAIWLVVQSLHGSPHRAALARPAVVKLTIPEGETRRQIAAIAKSKGIEGDYLAASRRSSLLHPERYGAPAGTSSLEGFLFPATYEAFAGASAQRLVTEQLAAFRENFGSAEISRARALRVTPYELLTVASMIEREAEVQRDRPLIAAVIYNRLRDAMPLGIDATIRYALNDYSKPLTEAQLKSSSPYNTRAHTGLPPTPIANPGAASIHAAAHPAHVSYLYYVAAADGCGEHVFSTSFAQFERDSAAYREALARNHGRVPSCRRG